jgi:hypothetical protein
MFVLMHERLLVGIAMHSVQQRRARCDVSFLTYVELSHLSTACVCPNRLIQSLYVLLQYVLELYSCSRHQPDGTRDDGDRGSNNHQPHKAGHARSRCVHSHGVGCVCGQKHQGGSCAGSFKVESCVWAPLHKPNLGTREEYPVL